MAGSKSTLTAARLRELLHYDPETGVFTWRVRTNSHVAAGSSAGSLDGCGYMRIGISGTSHQAHRLAWLHVHGRWPDGDIDHIDGNREKNRISNLRDVAHSVNQQNQRRAHSRNKSCGLLGVGAHRLRWRAQIMVDGKRLHLGTFDTPEQAHDAYISAKRLHHAGCTI